MGPCTCLEYLGIILDTEKMGGGAMVLGNLPVLGHPTIWITVGKGLLAVGAGGGCLDIFTLIYPFFPISSSLWETAQYRLKYCLKGPLNPKPTNQPTEKIEARVPLDKIWRIKNFIKELLSKKPCTKLKRL